MMNCSTKKASLQIQIFPFMEYAFDLTASMLNLVVCICPSVNHIRWCPLINSFPYLFSSSVKRPGIANSRVLGDERIEVMSGNGVGHYVARQVRVAQVAEFNHRPPHLINGHAEAKISPRPPLIYDRGSPGYAESDNGSEDGLCKRLLPLKVPNPREKNFRMIVAAGIY